MPLFTALYQKEKQKETVSFLECLQGIRNNRIKHNYVVVRKNKRHQSDINKNSFIMDTKTGNNYYSIIEKDIIAWVQQLNKLSHARSCVLSVIALKKIWRHLGKAYLHY